MGRIIPYIVENKTCLKPPTSYLYIYYCIYHCIPEPATNPTESGVMFTNFANMLPPLHPVAVKGSPFHVHSSAVRPSVYTQSPGCSRQFHLPQSWSKCWGDHPWSFNRNVRPPSDVSWFITPITMVYGTYNELVTGAFVNQLTSLGDLTL